MEWLAGQNITGHASSSCDRRLLKLVQTGDIADCEFVLAILRNYEGQPFIHKVSKEIIKQLPPESPFRTEVAIALESTGVVMGEFGLAEAYERKKTEVQGWITDPDINISCLLDLALLFLLSSLVLPKLP